MNTVDPSSLSLPVYLDYCATTPVDPRVLETMLPYFSSSFGNASSRDHSFGWNAREAVEQARSNVADLVGAHTSDIVFTSGATESINFAIKGVAAALKHQGNHIITTQVEHQAVLATCHFLEHFGYKTTYLPVDGNGQVDLHILEGAIRPETILISVMHANNETGVLFPIREIGSIAHKHSVLFLTDATQTVGKIPVILSDAHVDIAAFSAHKLYGPKGAGALYLRTEGLRKAIVPQLHGGGQEAGLRSGTLNVPAIAGFGEACRIALLECETNDVHCRALRDHFEKELTQELPGMIINGKNTLRLSHVSNCSFSGMSARERIRQIGSIAVAIAAACSSGYSGSSHVLQAMGVAQQIIDGSIRFSLGRFSQKAEIDFAVQELQRTCQLQKN